MTDSTPVSAAVTTVLNEWFSGEPVPRSVNTGECEPFAHEVCHAVPESCPVEIRTTKDIPSVFVIDAKADEYDPEPWHVWVTDGDLQYDAETTDGVPSWRDLPFFQRTLGV